MVLSASNTIRSQLNWLPVILLLFGALSSVESAVLNLDVCRFRGEQGKVIVELYIDLPRSALSHRKDSTGWSGSVELMAVITRDDLIAATDRWKVTDTMPHADEINLGQHIVDARVYHVLPGIYNISVTASDELSGGVWSNSVEFEASAFDNQVFNMSDIQIGNYIIPEGLIQQFDRNSFGIVPSPERIFSRANSFLVYYVEYYPSDVSPLTNVLTIERSIVNGRGEEVKTLESIEREGSGESFSDVDSISLAGLGSDIYNLVLRVKDGSQQVIQKSAKFYVLDGEYAASLPKTILDSALVEDELSSVRFLLVPRIRKRILDMTLEEKAEFLEAFWQRHDDDLSTVEVPARRLFSQRVGEADEIYTTYRQPGHQTERGRIYSLHGPADYKEAHPLDINTKPYEIWYYDRLEGGVMFIFVDRTGLGEYSLVHSTKTGEVYNADWYEDFVDRLHPGSGR